MPFRTVIGKLEQAERFEIVVAGRRYMVGGTVDYTPYLGRVLRLEVDEYETVRSAQEELDSKSWEQLSAEMTKSGAELRMVGEPYKEHPGIKVLVAALHSLFFKEDGTMVDNYMGFEFSVKPAGGFDEFRVCVAVTKPGAKTPHELRMLAENELKQIKEDADKYSG